MVAGRIERTLSLDVGLKYSRPLALTRLISWRRAIQVQERRRDRLLYRRIARSALVATNHSLPDFAHDKIRSHSIGAVYCAVVARANAVPANH
jgi:hypothetical protein